jgi:phage terminase Nu1 subunit (DNA packaging protein)
MKKYEVKAIIHPAEVESARDVIENYVIKQLSYDLANKIANDEATSAIYAEVLPDNSMKYEAVSYVLTELDLAAMQEVTAKLINHRHEISATEAQWCINVLTSILQQV